MAELHETVLPPTPSYAGTYPFTVTRTVKWGDCDPAGIIYTPRVLDYAMEILEAWYREVVGVPWLTLNRDMGLGAPTIRAELDILDAPCPDQDMVLRLLVEALGRSIAVGEWRRAPAADREFFRAKLVSCFISRAGLKSTDIPDAFRERILAYQKACDDG